MTKYILTDVDQTILDWHSTFAVYASKKLGRQITGLPTQYSMKDWLGIDVKKISELAQDFNDNCEMFEQLRPCYKSKEYLQKFYTTGYEIVAISASSDKNVSLTRRKQNLNNIFGDIFSEVYCVACPEDKRKYLEQFPPSIWVEDKIYNSLMGLDYSHKSFLIRSASSEDHEVQYPHLNWVNDWEDIWAQK
jgi:hypothetical protein